PASTPLPYTTLFRSHRSRGSVYEPRHSLFLRGSEYVDESQDVAPRRLLRIFDRADHGNLRRQVYAPLHAFHSSLDQRVVQHVARSEEHTSELQSLAY